MPQGSVGGGRATMVEPTALRIAPSSTPRARQNLILIAACLCQLMVALDISVVNVALPAIDGSLHFTPAALSWVVSAYTLTFGGLLLLGARMADLMGHRRTMVAALALFGVASILGGLAQSPEQLIAARAVQGLAAAVLAPATLTVLMVTFPEGHERRRAMATWGMVATAGVAVGVLASGLLTEYLEWRWVLFVNVPFVLAAGAFVVIAVRDRPSAGQGRLDLGGAALGTASLSLLSYGCVLAGEQGWVATATLMALAAAILAGATFVAWELLVVEAPLVRLSLLRTRSVGVATVIIALVGAATVAGFYFASLFLQT